MKTSVYDFARQKGIIGFLDVLVMLLSLILVINISVDTFRNIPFYAQPEYMKLQFWICILFLIDFLVEFLLSPHKGRYFLTHFVFLLVAIPYHAIFSALGWTSSAEVAYIFRFIPLIRGGYAMALIVRWFTKNKVTGLFVAYLVILFLCIYFGSLVFYFSELNVNTLVKDYSDALWWAFMDATTVGSNIIAVTATGKILSVILAAVGMMMFPIFTVYVTNLVEKNNKEGGVL